MTGREVVYIVGMEPLDSGPEGSAWPEAAFSTREAAEAWGRARGAKLVGTRHWWGHVTDVATTYEVWKLTIDAEGDV